MIHLKVSIAADGVCDVGMRSILSDLREEIPSVGQRLLTHDLRVLYLDMIVLYLFIRGSIAHGHHDKACPGNSGAVYKIVGDLYNSPRLQVYALFSNAYVDHGGVVLVVSCFTSHIDTVDGEFVVFYGQIQASGMYFQTCILFIRPPGVGASFKCRQPDDGHYEDRCGCCQFCIHLLTFYYSSLLSDPAYAGKRFRHLSSLALHVICVDTQIERQALVHGIGPCG